MYNLLISFCEIILKIVMCQVPIKITAPNCVARKVIPLFSDRGRCYKFFTIDIS